MEEQTPPNHSQESNTGFPPMQQNLPNATTVLVLGILSIVFSCWYFSVIGIVLGIVALVLANKDLSLYYMNRDHFTLSSFNNLKAGRVCAIIGLAVACIFLIFVILIIFGLLATMPFWGMID